MAEGVGARGFRFDAPAADCGALVERCPDEEAGMLELPVNTSITAAAGAAGGWPDAGRIPINSSVINMNSEWIDLIRTLPFGMNFRQLARLQRI